MMITGEVFRLKECSQEPGQDCPALAQLHREMDCYRATARLLGLTLQRLVKVAKDKQYAIWDELHAAIAEAEDILGVTNADK